MSNPSTFTASADDFNRRAVVLERQVSAMEQEREILLETSRDSGVMVGHARKMLAKISHTITFPEGFAAPAGEQAADKAAE